MTVFPSFSTNLAILEEFTTVKIGMTEPKLDELTGKVTKTFAAIVQIPVEPGQLIVLAVAVVVTALRSGDFIASCEHGNSSKRSKQGDS
jgi:hypothetical protein